jgi:hypothetical protein
MKIEVHLIRGEAKTLFDFTEPGLLRVYFQMGLPKEHLQDRCNKAVTPEILERVIKLYSDENHPKEMIENGRNMIIRELA